MGDITKGHIVCPHCKQPINLTGSIPPVTGCALVPIMFYLVCLVIGIFALLWVLTELLG